MSADAAGRSSLAERYASALFELADEAKQLDGVAGDLTDLRQALAESADLRRLIDSPILGREAQSKAIQAVAQALKLAPLTANFIAVVARKRRLAALPAMIAAFLAELSRRRGETTAEVVSATPLSEQQQAKLAEVLRGMVGGKVTIDARVDQDILGGLVVKVGSRMFDSSIRTKLQRLQLAMKGVG
ncbi:MAG: F0F1 ATP synthase subunit delta [Reyranellaceae bacterium]